jgi:LPXTG-motif cell wall-anchored protein
MDEDDTQLASDGPAAESRDGDAMGTNGHEGTNGHDNVLRSDADASSRDATGEPIAANEPGAAASESEELPRTASTRPLLLGLGLTALASGAAIGWSRRRRDA